MPLNKTILATAIEIAIKDIEAETEDTRKLMASAIADAVIDHIVANAIITVSAGILVATAGTAVSQTGATTSPGTGTIA